MESLRKRSIVLAEASLLFAVIIVLGISLLDHKSISTSKNTPVASQVIIQITPSGFIPATLHIQKGTVVTWKNTDTAPHQVVSNPYSQGNATRGLNSNVMVPNSSYSYTPSVAGTIGYHDETNLTSNGTVVVE